MLTLLTIWIFFETVYLDVHGCYALFIHTDTFSGGVEVTEARNGDGADAVGLSVCINTMIIRDSLRQRPKNVRQWHTVADAHTCQFITPQETTGIIQDSGSI